MRLNKVGSQDTVSLLEIQIQLAMSCYHMSITHSAVKHSIDKPRLCAKISELMLGHRLYCAMLEQKRREKISSRTAISRTFTSNKSREPAQLNTVTGNSQVYN